MMDRPRSIQWFERSFLAALALSLLSVALLWPELTQEIATRPGTEQLGAGAVQAVLLIGAAVVAALGLLLWYFVARRGSGVARWVAVLVLAYSIYSTATGLAGGGGPTTLATICAVASLVLELVALVMLFLPDARLWFGRDASDQLS